MLIIRNTITTLLLAFVSLGQMAATAQDRATVGGYVYFGETPLCALVLINGQSQFSCDGAGRYDMDVPVDGNGMITVQAFADGFAPVKEILTPQQAAEYPIDMFRDENGRIFEVESVVSEPETEGRASISGSVEASGTPVCALVLANGQTMFSCQNNLGVFSLEVPLDENGEITLMIFAAGFQPYKDISPADPDSDTDGVPDRLDDDDDNDGIFDVDDACPVDPDLNCTAAPLSCSVYAGGSSYCAEGTYPTCRPTRNQLLQIQVGMTYKEAITIAGCHPVLETWAGNTNSVSNAVYFWGSQVNVYYGELWLQTRSGGAPTVAVVGIW